MNKTKDIVGRCVKIFARRILAPALIGGESLSDAPRSKSPGAIRAFGFLDRDDGVRWTMWSARIHALFYL